MSSENPIVEVAGETLILLPEKMIWWQAKRSLLFADSHFGKASTFRKAGIPVPTGTTNAMLDRLDLAIKKWSPQRLVALGDFVHSAQRNETGFEAELFAWRQRHLKLQILLIRGNHDRGHQPLFQQMDLEIVAEPHSEAPFAFCHDHTSNSDRSLYTLAGHVHPGFRILEPQTASAKVPCFYFSECYAILPAFGEFTGCEIVQPKRNDRVFTVADGEVCEVPALLAKAK